MANIDLFGNEIIEDVLLRDKYIEPPFTRLDAVGGNWQKRKKMWLQRGLKSEIGRKAELCLAQGLNKYDPRQSYTGTSVFDPVLCELMYRWFLPENGTILDPFAGGSVRGIVANYLGYNYTGIELRQEQVDSNREQALDILPINKQPQWYCGDSNNVLNDTFNVKYDLLFTCPPYMDLEVYSDLEDDLSTMDDAKFIDIYEQIIDKACKLLKNNAYAICVVGDVRDKKTGYYKDFITITKMAFYKAGLKLYNEAILLENGLNTAAMRADKQFTASKKLIKVHQNVLIFIKP
jgi:DNA modification methylase